MKDEKRIARKEAQLLLTAFIQANLSDCCAELLEWSHTGLLPDGKVREAALIAAELDSSTRLALVEYEVKMQAFEMVASKKVGA